MESCRFTSVILLYLTLTTTLLRPNNFQQKLDSHQNQIYDEVKQERLLLFTVGVISGGLLSSLLVYSLDLEYPKCVIFALTYIIASAFYTLMPKKKYVVTYLHKDQIQDWLYVYKSMKSINTFFMTLAIASLILKF